MHSVEEGSAVAAAVAVRILNGEKAGDIKTPPTRYASPKYDWRQMQRWGISESDLPPGSTVLFKAAHDVGDLSLTDPDCLRASF